jgi:hypothetical protein
MEPVVSCYHAGVESWSARRTLAWLGVALSATAGCNALTGAADISTDGVGAGPTSVPSGGTGGGAGGLGPGPGPECGNGVCEPGEDCLRCVADCGPCAATCGNATCEAEEHCVNCPTDCGVCPPVCGNGACEAGEDCASCAADCGVCGPVCGNGACEAGEDCASCAADCGVCGPVCGNSACEAGEDCASCAADCGVCGPACGNSACEAGEDCANCAADCGACAPTEVHVDGGDCNSLQSGLDQAAAAALPLRLTGAFTVNCVVRIPSNVQINGAAATFTFTKAGRIRNKTNGNAGGYTHAGGFVWDGGTFVGAGNGIFTISHSPGFTIQNTLQYAYAETGDDGHSIEINSSGGPHTPNSYTVHITGNTFRGVTGQRPNSNDEAVQYDFSWDGSGGDGPYDATMCANLYIANNTFHRLDESGTWHFALCAIGAHRGTAGEPAERHNGILIENNAIHGAVGATADVSPDKGAIGLWNARDVWILNNAFFGCTSSRLVSGWDANSSRHLNDSTMNINIAGNTHDGNAVTITMPASNTTGG